MRVLAVAAFALVLVAPPGPAHAAVEPHGLYCSTAASALAGAAVLTAGPLTLVDDAAPGPVSGRVTCTLQEWGAHADPDVASATSPTSTGVAVLAPTVVTFAAEPWYLCTQVDVDGGPTLYFDDYAGAWSTNPQVACDYLGAEACPLSGCEPGCGVGFDECLCPLFKELFPPEGDIVLPVVGPIWDCPPYGNVGVPDGRS